MSNEENLFLSVIERIFSNWTALKLAVEHGMGSKRYAEAFAPYVDQLFSMNDNLSPTEVADELEDYMDAALNTELEDGSAILVAEELVRLHRLCVSNSENSLTEIEKLPPLQSWLSTLTSTNSTSQSASQQNESSSDSEETSNDQMEVEEEWTTVKTRRKK